MTSTDLIHRQFDTCKSNSLNIALNLENLLGLNPLIKENEQISIRGELVDFLIKSNLVTEYKCQISPRRCVGARLRFAIAVLLAFTYFLTLNN